MSKTLREILMVIAGLGLAVDAITASLLTAPGDIVPQSVIVTLLAVGAGLSAFNLFFMRDRS